MSSWFMRWVHSPTGPKTTHFWGPAANGFFPVQALVDWNRNPEIISKEMQFILMCKCRRYSGLFMRFAWQIKPRSYLLFAVHISNSILQGRLALVRYNWEKENPEKFEEQKRKLQEEKARKKQQNSE